MQIEKAGGWPREGVLVNGDSGNDVELFAVPRVKGCMVANAHPELREWCDAHASPNIFQVSAAGTVVRGSSIRHVLTHKEHNRCNDCMTEQRHTFKDDTLATFKDGDVQRISICMSQFGSERSFHHL